MNGVRRWLCVAVGVAAPLVVASCAEPTTGALDDQQDLGTKAERLLSLQEIASAAASSEITYLGQLCDGHGYDGLANFHTAFDAALWNYYYFDASAGDPVTIEVHRTSTAMDPAMVLFFGTTDHSDGLSIYGSTQPGMTFIHNWDDEIEPPHFPSPPGNWDDPQMWKYSLPDDGRYTLAVYDAEGYGPGPQVPYDILVEGVACGCEVSLVIEPTTLWPPDHEMHLVANDVSADAGCGGELVVTVTSNEERNGRGDGNTDSDWEVVDNGDGTFDVWVRAERSGRGSGRVYTITATVTDAAGNVTTASGTVTVAHDKGKRNK